MGVAKVNWDATLNIRNQKIGIRIVVHDYQGEVLANLSTSRRFNSQPILAECMALWRAIEFVEELRLPLFNLKAMLKPLPMLLHPQRHVMLGMGESWKMPKQFYINIPTGLYDLHIKKAIKWRIA